MTDDNSVGDSSQEIELDFFSPCPACGEIGSTIQTWIGGIQLMQCDDEDCRVEEYRPKVVE